MAETYNPHIKYHYCSAVTWKIYRYLNGPLDVNTPIESSEFITKLSHPVKWRLSIIGRRRLREVYVTEVLLRRSSTCTGPQVINVNVRIAILLRNGKGWYENYGIDKIHGEPMAANDTLLLRRPEIFENIVDCYNPTAENNLIAIHCDFFVGDSFTSNIDIELRYLSTDLYEFLMSSKLSNLNLILGEGTYSVDRAIAKARSPYVARILNDNPKVEEIDLTGLCHANQLVALIEYWYSADLENFPIRQSPSTLNFILNMQQPGLIRYVVPETIVMSTTFTASHKIIRWVIADEELGVKLTDLDRCIGCMYPVEKESWKLCFYPKVSAEVDYFSLYVEEPIESGLLNVHFEIYLTDELGKKYGPKCTYSLMNSPGKYKFPEFMKHDEFLKLRESLIYCNKLLIECRITSGTGEVKNQISSVSGPDISALPEVNPYRSLANDLKNLLESGDMSDISLKTENRIFRVHKSVLAARSVYFEDLFSDPGYRIPESGEISMEDVHPADLDIILKHMYYAEKIEIDFVHATWLYPALCKYKVLRLRNIFHEYFRYNVSKNSLAVFELACKVNDSYLRDLASKYVFSNHEFVMIHHALHRSTSTSRI